MLVAKPRNRKWRLILRTCCPKPAAALRAAYALRARFFSPFHSVILLRTSTSHHPPAPLSLTVARLSAFRSLLALDAALSSSVSIRSKTGASPCVGATHRLPCPLSFMHVHAFPGRSCVYRAPCGGGAEKRNLLAPSPRCCMQRRATTAYRLPVPLGTPPLLNVWRLEPVKLPRARVTPHTGQPASHVSTQAWSARMAYRRSPDSAEARRPGKD